MPSSESSSLFRWLPRFRLRTLLIAMCMLGTGLGLVGNFWQRLLAQRRAISQVQGAGGKIIFTHEFGHYVDDFSGPREFRSTSIRTLPSGVRERQRVSASQTVVDYETLPGPAVLRMLLGDTAFATVDSVVFTWQSSPGELEPQLLDQFPKLRVLCLAKTQVSDAWLDKCARLPQLQALRIDLESADSEDLSLDRLGKLTQLSALSLSGSRMGSKWGGNEMCSEIGKLRQLKSLNLFHPLPVSSAVFRELRELRSLESLTIRRAPLIVDQGIEDLAILRSLRTLALPETTIGDGALATIAKLEELESLDLSNTQVTDAGMKQLRPLRGLRHLDLSRTQIGDESVHALAEMKELRILSLNFTQATAASLSTIAGLSELESLNLKSDTFDFSDEQLQQLHSLTKLRCVTLGPRVARTGIADLKKALPQCAIFAFNASGQGFEGN